MIIVNLKTYKEAYGDNAVRIAKACELVSEKYSIRIVVCPQAVDIFRVKQKTKAEVFAQHIDVVPFGKFTGWLNPETMVEAGISGTLINHSEHQLPMDEIKKRIDKCRELNITSVVCADSVETAKKISTFKPDFIAIEPPELIGGKVSVSTARPDLIKEAVKEINSKVLIGAGIRTEEDVRIAVSYGAFGVLSASEIAKSEDPVKSLENFARGFISGKRQSHFSPS